MKEIKVQLPTLTILTLIFVTLKLCDVIDWNWAIVLSPSIIQFLLIGLFGAIKASISK